MKKLLFHLLIFTLFAAAAGCSSGKDDDGNPDVRFYAVPASLNFEAGKTTLQLSISTTGYSTPVTDANAPVAIRAALEACRTPYAVTDMSKY